MAVKQEHDKDLERIIGGTMEDADLQKINANLPQEEKFWRYEGAEKIGQGISHGRGISVRGLLKAPLRLIGGGLPRDYQKRLQEKYGEEYFDASNATFWNVFVTKPLFYGGLTALIASSYGHSPWWGIAGALGLGFAEFMLRVTWGTIRYYSTEPAYDAMGEPILSILTLPYRALDSIVSYRRGVRERAAELMQGGKKVED